MSKKIKTTIFKDSVKDLGSGDSFYIADFLSKEEADDLQKSLMNEIEWDSFNIKGSPVPRLISVQGELEDNGTQPLYRHPVDSHPKLKQWCLSADIIKQKAEKVIGESLNHALIQLYRDGKDFISDHSDKTLDIKHNTHIVNVSLGETRLLVLKSKDKTHSQEIQLAHGSLYVLGWKTNMEYKHGIRRNADPQITLQPRISLTMRNIATYVREDGKLFGQGAIHKTEKELDENSHKHEEIDMEEDGSEMLKLFGQMNKQTNEETFISKRGFASLNYTDNIE